MWYQSQPEMRKYNTADDVVCNLMLEENSRRHLLKRLRLKSNVCIKCEELKSVHGTILRRTDGSTRA
jgi:hypothetical protein